jgi:large subunit ribosomal protein L18
MRGLKLKKEQYLRRRKRSKKSFPVEGEYRLCVYKSARHIEAQIIDDFNQTTLVAASSKEKAYIKEKVNKSELASLVGKSLSERAKAKKVKKVYFDRNGFRYHGRVKSFAEASRKGGLKF